MHIQKLTYVDFNGQERTEDFHFHLSLPEVARIEAEIGKPIPEYAKELSDGSDMPRLLAFIERVMLTSYGKKTEDGKSFYKSPELQKEFEYSNAYAELFEMMLTNPEMAQKFGEKVADNGKKRKVQSEHPASN